MEPNLDDQNQLETNEEVQVNENKIDHSHLLSKLIYKHWQDEANIKFGQNESNQEIDDSRPPHPNAPLHRLSDIIMSKIETEANKNDIIEEEEEDIEEEKISPSAPRNVLSDRLIELYPRIFQKGYSTYVNSQE